MSTAIEKKWGICLQTVLAVRANSDHRSEQITQLLYGECFIVLKVEDIWAYIQIRHDGYRGWILLKQITFLEEETYEQYGRTQQFCTELLTHAEVEETGQKIPILLGSPLVEIPGVIYYGETYLFKPTTEYARMDNLQELAHVFFGAPYMWGGRSPMGVDCSGLTQVLYRMINVKLSRDASQQAEEGKLIPIDEMQMGDLAFFKDKSNKISHVGIVWFNQQILHATQQGVCIQDLHRKGIFDGEQYTHQLAWIRRYI